MPTSDSPHTAGVPPSSTASVELPKIPVAEAIALMMALLVAVFAFQLNASMKLIQAFEITTPPPGKRSPPKA